MELEILRLCSLESPQLGVLMMDGVPTFTTLELPWNKNEHNTSCIPLGSYICKKRSASPPITAGLNETFEVLNVPTRSGILIHVANTVHDLKGCIGIGMSFEKFGSEIGIAESRRAFTKFMALLKEQSSFKLYIEHR